MALSTIGIQSFGLTDPGADKNIMWDDSASALTITGMNGITMVDSWRLTTNAHLSGTNYQDQGIATSIIDVTSTTNVKVKFRTVGLTDGNRIIGNSTEDLTSFKFIRLGDT